MPARTRHTVLALFAAALVVLAITLRFGLSTEPVRTPLPSPATPVQQREPAPPPSTAVAPTPEPLPPATSEAEVPPATPPVVPAPADEPLPPNTATTAPNPAPSTREPASPYYAPLLTWMRQQFGHFLNQLGPPFATLSEAQRDTLFAEFLAWHRTRTSADPPNPTTP